MEYMQALLQKQTQIAVELETEPEAARELWAAAIRMRRAQEEAAEAPGTRQTPRGSARREDGEAGEADSVPAGGGAESTLRKLEELDAARARVRRLSEVGAQPGSAAFAAPAAAAAMRTAGQDPFFTVAQGEMPRTWPGAEDARTQRSMQEISRFFERDARRYGG